MNTSCYAVNIRSTIDKNDHAYIGEDALNLLIDGFSCPPNLEVEHFLKHSALDFTKENQSVTYLAFRPATHGDIFAGYYSLAIKPISVRASAISKTMGKKLARVSVLNPENDTFTASAYLIAQLGKNFALPKEKRISGKELPTFADLTIKWPGISWVAWWSFWSARTIPFSLTSTPKTASRPLTAGQSLLLITSTLTNWFSFCASFDVLPPLPAWEAAAFAFPVRLLSSKKGI